MRGRGHAAHAAPRRQRRRAARAARQVTLPVIIKHQSVFHQHATTAAITLLHLLLCLRYYVTNIYHNIQNLVKDSTY